MTDDTQVSDDLLFADPAAAKVVESDVESANTVDDGEPDLDDADVAQVTADGDLDADGEDGTAGDDDEQ